MIELMLEAERALAVGLLDKAEKQYATVVARDPRNAIAIVGLARVALERGDQLQTYLYARKALAIDPDNPAASHLVHRMGEQLAMRGEPLPAEPVRQAASVGQPGGPVDAREPVAEAAASPPAAPAPSPVDARREPARRPAPTARRILDRLRGRSR